MPFRPVVAALVTLSFLAGGGAQELDWHTQITLGPLQLGLSEAAVVESLGEPAEKGAVVLEGATGLYVTEWAWPGKGVWVTLSSETENGPRQVERLQLAAPASFKTPQDLGIGSTRDAVLAAYRKELDPETPPTEQAIVVGSLFGGMIFTLEQGVVTEIFLGAAAE